VLGELIDHQRELADIAGETVDAEDEKCVESPGLAIVKHLFEAGAVHVGSRLGVAVDLMEAPVVSVLSLAEGPQTFMLGTERIFLVVFVG
jgi:hypothetical protein